MQKKKAIALFGAAAGLKGAVACDLWPGYTRQIQMMLHTVMTLGLLLVGFWPDRNRKNFWAGVAFVAFLHVAILIAIRSWFPFRTILAVIPMAIMEATIAATLLLRILGY
jgi:hypothetical protein